MSKKEREQILITLQIPSTMKELIGKIVTADTHSNMSEFIRDAIRQKIEKDYPGLIQSTIRDDLAA